MPSSNVYARIATFFSLLAGVNAVGFLVAALVAVAFGEVGPAVVSCTVGVVVAGADLLVARALRRRWHHATRYAAVLAVLHAVVFLIALYYAQHFLAGVALLVLSVGCVYVANVLRKLA